MTCDVSPVAMFFYDETLKETAQDYGFPSQIAAPYVFRDSIVNPQKKNSSQSSEDAIAKL